ncbi:hypothetical protein BO78DRAFT_472951 [Aspergillus sclerotiicarbonarius CBS 121057]|uniref:Uncharacterized protein n=1 Tax=Aspergillus sclerotiicarbonarius (strain CBS 121057 / IBT 28362) TaxID=1448318 RepID=A0A319EMI2_ASPSB|nr:hypothetical protein BO78DRAFT_472951 [Aspergillus sclerotiicarbonarius CBS 121057]
MAPDTVDRETSTRLLAPHESTKMNQTDPTKPASSRPTKPKEIRFWPQIYVPILVMIYVGLLLAAWSIICLLSRGRLVRSLDSEEYYTADSINVQAFLTAVSRWHRAGTVLWNIVGVATIPLASAVCSFAAVGFLQSQKYRKADLTLRQTLVIADHGWTNPNVILSMFWRPKKLGSALLYVALFLHILGAILNPLQGLLVGQTTIKIPLRVQQLETVADIYALTDSSYLAQVDYGSTVAALRSTLSTTRPSDTYQNLWPANASCSCHSENCGLLERSVFTCQRARTNIQNVAVVEDSEPALDLYMSTVSTTANTGLLRQYAPRINSSVTWENVSADQFPPNCSGTAFFKNYTLTEKAAEIYEDWYSISVCMMGNLSHTPFQRTRHRQDFNETLFLTANTYEGSHTIRLTLSTTAGYFELPNDMRNGTAGPLLDANPLSNCTDTSCGLSTQVKRDHVVISNQTDGWVDGSFYLDLVPSKGPLALITLALFGEHSSLDPSLYHPLSALNSTNAAEGYCYNYPPLTFLLSEHDNRIPMACNGQFDQSAYHWINDFFNPEYGIPALSRASFLANQALFNTAGQETLGLDNIIAINYQPSCNLTRPNIPRASMIGLSVLIAIYLFLLIGLCIANLTQVPWAGSVDSQSIMKITAALCSSYFKHEGGEKLLSKENDDDILDILPGTIGDAEPHAKVGRLAVGAETPLKWRRRYWKGDGFAL